MSAELWAKAFLAAQKAMPTITKNQKATIPTKTGGSYSYTYADLADISDAAVPVLNANGLSIAQDPVSEGNQIGVATRIYHESGHVETFGPLLLGGGSDARGAGSAVTYARRYALAAALGIVVEDDDDGARATPPEPEPVEEEVTPQVAFKIELFEEYEGDKDQALAEWERCKASIDKLEVDDDKLTKTAVKQMRKEHKDNG